MRLLLDTHALIWSMASSARLSPVARQAMLNPSNECFVSAVSLWEIAMKHAAGKLDLVGETPEGLMDIAMQEMGFGFVSLKPEVACTGGQIPKLHGDPFDRLLIHQAICEDYHLVSADKAFTRYEDFGLRLIW